MHSLYKPLYIIVHIGEYLVKFLPILLLVAIVTPITCCTIVHARSDKDQPVVIVTFSYLKSDVELIMCDGLVDTLVPPGIDPHDYQLKPSDLEALKSADIIVSTGHTHFELEIRDLVERGELRAKLVDVLETPGIRVLTNPVTGQLNYHLPIKDPLNYLVFMSVLARTLAEVDPSRGNCYYRKFHDLAEKLAEEILLHRGLFSGNVVVDSPHAQYYVEWLGFRVIWVAKPEEGVQVTPENVQRLRELVESGDIVAVIVTKPVESPESRFLVELASECGVPVVEVYGPASSVGVYSSLLDVVKQFKELNLTITTKLKPASGGNYDHVIHYFVFAAVSFVIGLVFGVLVSKVKRW